MFIYRPEVYEKEETKPEDQGIAEIIIGKQRNGPIGSVRLSFLNQFTRFENLRSGRGVTVDRGNGGPGTRYRGGIATPADDLRVLRARGESWRQSKPTFVPLTFDRCRRVAARDLRIPAVRRSPAHHRGRQGECLRAWGGGSGARARGCRGGDAGVRGYRRGDRAAPGGGAGADPGLWRAEHQRSRRPVHTRPDADDLDAAARRARCRRRPRASATSPWLPPQDRHRDEPARFSPRQPASGRCPSCSRARTSRSTPSTRTSRPPTIPNIRPSTSSASASRAALPVLAGMGSRPARNTPPTARRCCGTNAFGTTTSAPACCSTGSCRRRWPRRCRCDLPCHSIAVSWR